MEVVSGDSWTTGAICRAKLQSNHHHQQTNIQFFLQAGCHSCRPTNSVRALKGNYLNRKYNEIRSTDINIQNEAASYISYLHDLISLCVHHVKTWFTVNICKKTQLKRFTLLVFNGTFSTNRLYRAIGVWNVYCIGPATHSNRNKPNKRKNTHKHSLPTGLCGGNLLST